MREAEQNQPHPPTAMLLDAGVMVSPFSFILRDSSATFSASLFRARKFL